MIFMRILILLFLATGIGSSSRVSAGKAQLKYLENFEKTRQIRLQLNPKPFRFLKFTLEHSADELTSFNPCLVEKLRRVDTVADKEGIWCYRKDESVEAYDGTATFSNPVLSSDKRLCMFYCHVLLDSLSGSGSIVQMSRTEDGWKVDRIRVIVSN